MNHLVQGSSVVTSNFWIDWRCQKTWKNTDWKPAGNSVETLEGAKYRSSLLDTQIYKINLRQHSTKSFILISWTWNAVWQKRACGFGEEINETLHHCVALAKPTRKLHNTSYSKVVALGPFTVVFLTVCSTFELTHFVQQTVPTKTEGSRWRDSELSLVMQISCDFLQKFAINFQRLLVHTERYVYQNSFLGTQ